MNIEALLKWHAGMAEKADASAKRRREPQWCDTRGAEIEERSAQFHRDAGALIESLAKKAVKQ